MKIKYWVWLLLALFRIESLDAKPIRPGKILQMIRRSAVLNKHFTGFSLYDLDKRKMIAGQNSDKYFTPASNTKLLTFYAGLKLLKDSIAGLHYIEKGDSLVFWGTADPSFINPDFKQQPVLLKLNSTGKNIYWARGLFSGSFYGAGWTYDDYNEYYQPEMSELPLYGNIIRFNGSNNSLKSYPAFNAGGPLKLITDSALNTGKYHIKREILNNVFHQPALTIPAAYRQVVPFKLSNELISGLLKQNIPGFSGSIELQKPDLFKTWYSIPADTLYKHMLLPSDNFIAEQILLNIAAVMGLEMNTSVVIDSIKKNLLTEMPDEAVWVDGSGLSRQNLFTPRSLVWLCEKIYDEVGDQDRLFDLLPQGGKTGTLKNQYKAEKPFVFAKTGSLSNNSNLTGYLITKNRQRLIFSFMNNNFVGPAAGIRSEIERILTKIHQDN